MRPACLDCARKHIAQAMVLVHESKQGYPVHKWYAIGHLAEASDELIAEYPAAAASVRKERLAYMKDEEYKIDYAKLIELVSQLKPTDNCCTESKKEALQLIRLPICMACPHRDPTTEVCNHLGEEVSQIVRDLTKGCPIGSWPQ